MYVGKSFTVLPGKGKDHPYFQRQQEDYIVHGVIDHIVAHKEDHSTLWFAFYDTDKHRRPPTVLEEWHYARCEDFIGSKAKLIKWDVTAVDGKQLVSRKVCVYFKSHSRYYKGKIINYRKENKKKPYEVLFEDNEIHAFSESVIVPCIRV